MRIFMQRPYTCLSSKKLWNPACTKAKPTNRNGYTECKKTDSLQVFLSNFAYLATALAEGIVTQLHSVHGELPVALPAHGQELLVLETDARWR